MPPKPTHFLAALALVGPALALGGDDCATPTGLNTFGTFPFDTTAATTSGFDGGGLCAIGASSINQDVFWVFTAPITGAYQFDTEGSAFDTQIAVHLGANCAATCLEYNDDSSTGLQSLVLVGGITAGTELLVQVGGFGASSGTGVLNISPFVDPCSLLPDDSLENNDTCATARAISAGTYPGLFVSRFDRDYYRVTLQPGEAMLVNVTNPTSATTDVNIYDDQCIMAQLGRDGSVSWANLFSTTPRDFVIQVLPDPLAASNCTGYDLEVTVAPAACAGATDDSLEPNDSCATAVTLGNGYYPGLSVFTSDNDFYAIGLDPGATLRADILFVDADGDLDLYLWDPNLGCGTTSVGIAGPYLARGFSSSDNESLTYTNSTGVTQALILEIDMFTEEECNGYDLQIAGTNGTDGGLGTNYCPANPNSIGAAGRVSATGSSLVTDNAVTLRATELPPFAFGFFIVSRTQGFVANSGGSSGNVCLSGSIGRLIGPGQIMDAGFVGQVTLPIDLTSIPQPMNTVSVVAGDTWNFQLWYRDSTAGGTTTSNFTDGLEVMFL